MHKYDPLQHYLAGLADTSWTAGFSEIEKLIGGRLPPSAAEHRAWWANHGGRMVHQQAWLDAGWRVTEVDLSRRTVTFGRARLSNVVASFQGAQRNAEIRVRRQESPAAYLAESLTVRIGWRPLGACESGAEERRAPAAPNAPGLCRFRPLGAKRDAAAITAVDNLVRYLASRPLAGPPAAAESWRRPSAGRFFVEVAPAEDVWIVVQGKGRRADLSDPVDRALVENAAAVSANAAA